MKSFLPLLAVLLVLNGCSSVPEIDATAAHIPDGRYVPDPKKTWYAGAIIEVHGDQFSYQRFSDVLEDKPIEPVTGSIQKEGDRFVFRTGGTTWAVWILASARGRPALWSVDGYERWKAGKKAEPDDVLYLEKKPNQPSQPMPLKRHG
jgi:hypothetical protein